MTDNTNNNLSPFDPYFNDSNKLRTDNGTLVN